MANLLRILLAIFVPPVAVLFTTGIGVQLILNIVLTILGWLPGSVHALYLLTRANQDPRRP